MGTGFMLLETQVLSRLALYFGTTWQVNGIVISALLISLLAANAIAAKRRAISRGLILCGLFIGLAIAYFTPFPALPFHPATVGIIAAVIFAIPVFFAGLLFSREFASAFSPSAALGANVLGAVLGGLLENLSLLIGMRALLLVAAVVYAVASLALTRKHNARVGSSEAV